MEMPPPPSQSGTPSFAPNATGSRKRTFVYNVFEKVGDEAKCKLCKKVLSHKSHGGTSTPSRHISASHPD